MTVCFAPPSIELLNLWTDFRKVVKFIDENPWVKPMLEKIIQNRVGGKRSSFLPTFVFRPLTPPYVPFGIRRFFIVQCNLT